MSGVTVKNVNVTSENGIVMVGMPGTPIQNVAIIDTVVSMTNMTDFPGGFMDLRPSIIGKRTGTTDSGLYVENVNQLELQNLQVRPGWLACTLDTACHAVCCSDLEPASIADAHRLLAFSLCAGWWLSSVLLSAVRHSWVSNSLSLVAPFVWYNQCQRAQIPPVMAHARQEHDSSVGAADHLEHACKANLGRLLHGGKPLAHVFDAAGDY